MSVNSDVDGYTNTGNHRKTLRKTQKATTDWKLKEYKYRIIS